MISDLVAGPWFAPVAFGIGGVFSLLIAGFLVAAWLRRGAGPGSVSAWSWLPLPGVGRRPSLAFLDSSGADVNAAENGPPDDLRAAIKVAQVVFQSALAARATALLSAQTGDGAFLIEYRVDGKPKTAAYLSGSRGHDLVRAVKWLAGVEVDEVYRPQHGGFSMQAGGRTVRVTVATNRNVFGERFEARLLDGELAGGRFRGGLSGIGLPAEVGTALRTVIDRHRGLVLICGPRESGRTTTLYATVGDIGPRRHSIVAVEENPQCEIAGIRQERMNREEGRSPSDVVAGIMRSDPEVILLDEIRDQDTAVAAARAAVDRIVVATIEADDAADVVAKLIAWGTPAELLEGSLAAVVSQRLVRVLCAACKRPCRPPAGFSRKLRSRRKVKRIYRSKGCGDCTGSGFRGLRPVHELLVPDEAMWSALKSDPSRRGIRAHAREAGMRTLREAALELVRDGVTSLREVVRVVP